MSSGSVSDFGRRQTVDDLKMGQYTLREKQQGKASFSSLAVPFLQGITAKAALLGEQVRLHAPRQKKGGGD